MRRLFRVTSTEFKLLLRDATALFVALALPVRFLLVFGSMASGGPRGGPAKVPGADSRASGEFFSAMAVSISLGMWTLFTIPTYLGTYRERTTTS
jgi:hypothetical protein